MIHAVHHAYMYKHMRQMNNLICKSFIIICKHIYFNGLVHKFKSSNAPFLSRLDMTVLVNSTIDLYMHNNVQHLVYNYMYSSTNGIPSIARTSSHTQCTFQEPFCEREDHTRTSRHITGQLSRDEVHPPSDSMSHLKVSTQAFGDQATAHCL